MYASWLPHVQVLLTGTERDYNQNVGQEIYLTIIARKRAGYEIIISHQTSVSGIIVLV